MGAIKNLLIQAAEMIRDEKKDYANTAQRIGQMFVDIINAIFSPEDNLTSSSVENPLSANQGRILNENLQDIDSKLKGTSPLQQGEMAYSRPYLVIELKDINSLNTFPKCGTYHVIFNKNLVGLLYVTGDNMLHCLNQVLISNYNTEGITDGIPAAHIDGHVNIMRRVYNINSPHEFAPKNSWSDWEIIAGDDKPNGGTASLTDFKIVDFEGAVESATVEMVSLNTEATAEEVYFCKNIHHTGDLTSYGSGFILSKNGVYYNNWINRIDWADDSFTPYSNLFYREARSGVFYLYKADTDSLLPIGGTSSAANAVLSNDVRNIYIYNKANMPDINTMQPGDMYVITEE